MGGENGLVVVRLIGRGGSGTIYMAWDEANQRSVAVKFLHDNYAANPVLLARFEREGRVFSEIQHPNLVRVYTAGREGGRLYIVTEFVPGKNLYQLLKKEGPFPIRRALSICRDVAAGLHAAHQHNVVHRDLKPENIMVRTTDQIVKVLDFGIAKDLNASVDLTQLGTYIGTPAYSAPEQVRGEKVDHRADIFSLGVILYELLTGKVAFDGRHSTEILHATLRDDPIPVGEINHLVTRPVARVLERMIEKNPIHRFESMQLVSTEIARVLPQIREEYSDADHTSVRLALKEMFTKKK
jgi:serine/threonine-protein kinase